MKRLGVKGTSRINKNYEGIGSKRDFTYEETVKIYFYVFLRIVKSLLGTVAEAAGMGKISQLLKLHL